MKVTVQDAFDIQGEGYQWRCTDGEWWFTFRTRDRLPPVQELETWLTRAAYSLLQAKMAA